MKRDLLPSVKDPVALDLDRKSLKRLLDPNGILNPGKVLKSRHFASEAKQSRSNI